MSVSIQIQLSPQALAISEKFKRAPEQFPRAIQRGMNRALLITAGRIQERRLTGKGPFPISFHKLGERSGQLKLRTRSQNARILNQGREIVVEGAIGSSVVYAAANEFGSPKRHIPERAPFRTGIRENARFISDTINKEIERTLA